MLLNEVEIGRFFAKVDKLKSGCWVWKGSTVRGRSGLRYGQFWHGKKLHIAHRISYQHNVAPIPEGLTIDHVCRNTLCVNPNHLRVLSLRDNILAGTGPTARNAKKTHCPQGHPLSGDNLRAGRIGRECRICNNLSDKRSRQRKRGSANEHRIL